MRPGQRVARYSSRVWPALWAAVLFAFAGASTVRADAPLPFDLVGPAVQVRVTRGGATLPISRVANLQSGDQLWIRADLPERQSARYLLVVAFLQGPTNPPPDNWFTLVETWNRSVRRDGVRVTVPADAQQALLLLAPETGGGFPTLRSMVRARPGVFVRAAQDLEEASLDRTRLDKFLAEVRAAPGSDAAPLAQRVELLSRSLAVKADPSCFEKPMEQQSGCLTQSDSRLTLDGGSYQSVVATLTSGASADLLGSMSVTPFASREFFSPYLGSAMDMVRLLDGLHTAQYQYLPALTLPQQDDLNLRLNAPPSFRNPKSVLVLGLPAVQPVALPRLRPADAKQAYCAQKEPLVLEVTGAPLVFSTAMGHDFALYLQDRSGQPLELPAAPDAALGGFVVDTASLRTDQLADETTATLRGWWGFEPYEGPAFSFFSAQPAPWKVTAADAKALLAGREDTLHLESGPATCVEQVVASDAAGKKLPAGWTAVDAHQLEVRLALTGEAPGTVKLQVKQYGSGEPETIALASYSDAARLSGLAVHAGDGQSVLTGTHLDLVSVVDLVSGAETNGVRMVPASLIRSGQTAQQEAFDPPPGEDALALKAPAASAGGTFAALHAGEKITARVTLSDGRVLELQSTVQPPRPKVSLVSKTVRQAAVSSAVRFGNPDELPQDGQLAFLLKAEGPHKFPRGEQIEVATEDGGARVLLSLSGGGLVLQDEASALATLSPLRDLGPSAFGPLQFRPVDAEGARGEWQPLAKLVRVPTLKEVRCPDAPDRPCSLGGRNLFLLGAVASDAAFTAMTAVPAGYSDSVLEVPRPSGTLLYIKLRDDPETVDTVALPVLPADYPSK